MAHSAGPNITGPTLEYSTLYIPVYVTRFAKTRHIRTQWQKHFSSPIDTSINKLTDCHNTTATS